MVLQIFISFDPNVRNQLMITFFWVALRLCNAIVYWRISFYDPTNFCLLPRYPLSDLRSSRNHFWEMFPFFYTSGPCPWPFPFPSFHALPDLLVPDNLDSRFDDKSCLLAVPSTVDRTSKLGRLGASGSSSGGIIMFLSKCYSSETTF